MEVVLLISLLDTGMEGPRTFNYNIREYLQGNSVRTDSVKLLFREVVIN